jgi:hypothetical protein
LCNFNVLYFQRRRENENLQRALDLQEKMAAMRKHK